MRLPRKEVGALADVGQTSKRRVAKPPGERRREILEAALQLFLEKGFEDTTVQNIATRAGVAIGTVYLYFPSKNEVLLALHDDFHKGLEEVFLEGAGDFFAALETGDSVDYRDGIDEIIDSLFAYSLEHKHSCEVIFRHLSQAGLTEEMMETERHFVEFLTRAFETGMQAGLLHTSDPEMCAYLLDAAMSFTLGRAVAFGEPPGLDRLVAQSKELFYKALAPEGALDLPPRSPPA
ncbi:MAG: TetR/AcrR family transcriptional regulator [Actinomycetota bacterium]